MSIILAIIYLIPAYFLRGYVLMKLWLWFIVPFGIQEISIAQAIGIGLIVSFLTSNYNARKKPQEERIEEAIAIYVMPILVLIIAVTVRQFV